MPRRSLSNRKRRRASEQEYTVKGILEKKTIDGTVSYLLDWDNHPVTGESYEPSWEPYWNVGKPLIDDWKKEQESTQDDHSPKSSVTPKRPVNKKSRHFVDSSSSVVTASPHVQKPEDPDSSDISEPDSTLFVQDKESTSSVEESTHKLLGVVTSVPGSQFNPASYERIDSSRPAISSSSQAQPEASSTQAFRPFNNVAVSETANLVQIDEENTIAYSSGQPSFTQPTVVDRIIPDSQGLTGDSSLVLSTQSNEGNHHELENGTQATDAFESSAPPQDVHTRVDTNNHDGGVSSWDLVRSANAIDLKVVQHDTHLEAPEADDIVQATEAKDVAQPAGTVESSVPQHDYYRTTATEDGALDLPPIDVLNNRAEEPPSTTVVEEKVSYSEGSHVETTDRSETFEGLPRLEFQVAEELRVSQEPHTSNTQQDQAPQVEAEVPTSRKAEVEEEAPRSQSHSERSHEQPASATLEETRNVDAPDDSRTSTASLQEKPEREEIASSAQLPSGNGEKVAAGELQSTSSVLHSSEQTPEKEQLPARETSKRLGLDEREANRPLTPRSRQGNDPDRGEERQSHSGLVSQSTGSEDAGFQTQTSFVSLGDSERLPSSVSEEVPQRRTADDGEPQDLQSQAPIIDQDEDTRSTGVGSQPRTTSASDYQPSHAALSITARDVIPAGDFQPTQCTDQASNASSRDKDQEVSTTQSESDGGANIVRSDDTRDRPETDRGGVEGTALDVPSKSVVQQDSYDSFVAGEGGASSRLPSTDAHVDLAGTEASKTASGALEHQGLSKLSDPRQVSAQILQYLPTMEIATSGSLVVSQDSSESPITLPPTQHPETFSLGAPCRLQVPSDLPSTPSAGFSSLQQPVSVVSDISVAEREPLASMRMQVAKGAPTSRSPSVIPGRTSGRASSRLPTRTQKSEKAEFVVAIDLKGKTRDQYRATVTLKEKDIARLTGDSQIHEIERLLERLHNVVTNVDLESGPTQMDPFMQANWHLESSRKFRFLLDLFEPLRTSDKHVVVFARPGPLMDFLENFLSQKSITYARPDALRSENYPESSLTVTIAPTSGEVSDVVIRRADLVVALDNTIDLTKRTVVNTRRNILKVGQLAPVISLVVLYSPEHIERCLPASLVGSERLMVLHSAVKKFRTDAGTLPFGSLTVEKVAAQVAKLLVEDVVAWSLPAVDDSRVLQFIDKELSSVVPANTTEHVESAVSDAHKTVAKKRPMFDDGNPADSKRIKATPVPDADMSDPAVTPTTDLATTPATINPPDLELTRISDSVVESISQASRSPPSVNVSDHHQLSRSIDDIDRPQLVPPDNHASEHQKLVNELAAVRKQHAHEKAYFRQSLGKATARSREWESAHREAQTSQEEQKREISKFRREQEEAAAAHAALLKRFETQATAVTNLKEERRTLNEELAAARQANLSEDAPHRMELELLKNEAAKHLYEKEKLERRLRSSETEKEFFRSSYQDASNKAAALAAENATLTRQVAALTRRVNSDIAKVHQMTHDNANRKTEEENRRLRQTIADRDELLAKKEADIAAATQGRRGTRGTSVPMSSRPSSAGVGTGSPKIRSRQGTPVSGIADAPVGRAQYPLQHPLRNLREE
ncbi:hypothetical protein LTR16_001159 [Cryomyces antarcticus]|uniref:Chromo domain-containing protein n=1 Tax=Cryomyces antarcticus TaxID=329879 RepID=A0ABR0M1S3_9PEZI|nr:hypothetical protein LTR16_001159 [Cryomyces antarcticus]